MTVPGSIEEPLASTTPPSAVPSGRGRGDHDALLEFIASRDIECPACGYNLRGLKSPVCPECSGRLHLSVGSENTALGPWFLAIVSFALGAGFDLVVSVLLLVMGVVTLVSGEVVTPNDRSLWLTLFLSMLTLGAAGVVGLWWLFARRRTRWNRLGRRRQWHAAWIIFIAVGIVHAAFGLWWVSRF